MTTVNRQITLAAHPVGFPAISDFCLVYSPLASPAEGEVVVRSVYLSLDPGIRGRMNGGAPPGDAIDLQEVVPGGAAGIVLESRDPRFDAGDAVEGMLGWQEYAVVPGAGLRKIDPSDAPLSTALGVLGMPGLTAYFGLLDVCDPQPGETVVVSRATGAVGMVAGQIARIRGCRVVGVASSRGGTSWLLQELGFDSAFSHGPDVDARAELEERCPRGVDVYFDSEGGAVSDAVMGRINSGARIALCGQLSQDNLEKPEPGPRWSGPLIARQAKAQGFLVSSCAARFPEGLAQMAAWLKQGTLRYREEVAHGIEAAPQTFIGMLRGESEGMHLVRLPEPPPGGGH